MFRQVFLGNLFFAAAPGEPSVNPWSLAFFGILVLIVGAVSLIYPQVFWYLRIGHKLKGVNPSRLYLLTLRFGGILTIAVGIIIIYYAWIMF